MSISEQPSDKVLLPFTQAGKRATRVIHLGSCDLLHDSFKHWFQLRDRENRLSPEERAKIRDSATFFDKVLEKLPQFRQSLIHGDFSHRALEGAGPSMINSLIGKVRKSWMEYVFGFLLTCIVQIYDGCLAARTDDTGHLKRPILHYILHEGVVTHQMLDGLTFNKESRGFNHVTTARLLCPIQLVKDFDQDPPRYVCYQLIRSCTSSWYNTEWRWPF